MFQQALKKKQETYVVAGSTRNPANENPSPLGMDKNISLFTGSFM